MALFSCPECRTQISNQAEKCPKCGFVIKKKPSAIMIVIAVIGGIVALLTLLSAFSDFLHIS